MPPVAVQSNSGSARRSFMRQRENRMHSQPSQASSGSTRRRKSRSPDPHTHIASEVGPTQNDAFIRRKRRPVTVMGTVAHPSSNIPNTLVSRNSLHEDAADRGRAKIKYKSSKQLPALPDGDDDDVPIVTNIVQEYGRSNNTRFKRKERSRSRDMTNGHLRKIATPEPAEDDVEPVYTGPLAHAEYVRMKQEVENLRKQVAIGKKTMVKQSKVIDELRAALTTTNELQRTQRVEMESLQTRSKKSEDLIATMESSLTCQICMDVLLKPYGLSPCGHVLCMACLLQWFKSTPAGDDGMVDDDYPDAHLYRKKTCPCCRAEVRTRPIPLYVVKSLASALDKAKALPGAARPSPPPDEGDPWAGIFREWYDRDEYWSTDDDDDEEEDDEDAEDDEEYEDEDDYWSFDGYGTGEDEEQYNGPYVNSRWVPPCVYISPDKFPFLDDCGDEMTMLRRGATLEMIELFQMSYEHSTGICALVDGQNAVYLGWTIELHPDDESGEEYMDWILQDMYDRPERWRVVNDDDEGVWSAWKLVPEDEGEDYDNTDSEYWAEELAGDEAD